MPNSFNFTKKKSGLAPAVIDSPSLVILFAVYNEAVTIIKIE